MSEDEIPTDINTPDQATLSAKGWELYNASPESDPLREKVTAKWQELYAKQNAE